MMRLAAAIVASLLLGGTAALAEDGYWLSLEADDGTKAGLVFPDFQPNNFSVFWMLCPLDGGPAELILEFPVDNLKEGDELPVTFIVDDDNIELVGRGVIDEFQSSMIIKVVLERDDAFFDRLAGATAITIKIGATTFPTPIKGAWSAINNFTNLCRAR